MHMQTLWQGPAALGECPVWHPHTKKLYWVDCKKSDVYEYNPQTKQTQKWRFHGGVGCVAPARDGGLISFMHGAIVYIDTATGTARTLKQVFAADSGLRCNDGKCDRQGRFWVGTVSKNFDTPTGSLYCYTADGMLREMQQELYIANGLAWSPDDRYMYHCDSWVGKIYRYAFDKKSGDLAARELWFDYAKLQATAPASSTGGVPDGLTVDANGNIWTAVWDGGKLLCVSPEAEVMHEISMPVQRPTSCVFGGDDYKTLYVTSCSQDVHETAVLSAPNGALYALSDLNHTKMQAVAAQPAAVGQAHVQGIADGMFNTG